jgi:hypothetical protein
MYSGLVMNRRGTMSNWSGAAHPAKRLSAYPSVLSTGDDFSRACCHQPKPTETVN